MKPTPDPDDMGQILVSARSFAEYQAMFALHDDDLSGPVLDCPGGGSGFVAEAARRGVEACAADPVYALTAEQLTDLVLSEPARGTAHTVAGSDRYRWDFYGSPAEHTRVRAESARCFVSDFHANRERYVAAALPVLPFPNAQFRLVLSSHFLFTYADRLDTSFHLAALSELCRVANGEVRIFPLVDQAGGAAARWWNKSGRTWSGREPSRRSAPSTTNSSAAATVYSFSTRRAEHRVRPASLSSRPRSNNCGTGQRAGGDCRSGDPGGKMSLASNAARTGTRSSTRRSVAASPR
jgi:hypothetical protein